MRIKTLSASRNGTVDFSGYCLLETNRRVGCVARNLAHPGPRVSERSSMVPSGARFNSRDQGFLLSSGVMVRLASKVLFATVFPLAICLPVWSKTVIVAVS